MSPSDESLLGELALRLAKSPEDVATEGLVYILSRSAAARNLVQRLSEEWAGQSLRPIAFFRSQVVGSDDSRPDVEAQDADGKPVVIFEDKFWASLTDGQPVAYLSRLSERGGVLCFVVPAARTILLWDELTRRIGEAESTAVELVRDEPELKVGRVDASRALVLTSWGFILGQIRSALETEGNLALVADLRQLSGLAARMETSGFVPFTLSDLTAPTPRHVVQFCDVVDAAVARALQESFANKKGLKATAGAGWYGHYIRLHDHGCQLSFNAPMWNRFGRSPLWLWVRSPDWKPSDVVDQALARHYGSDECISVRDGWGAGGTWLAIRVLEGRELDVVVSDVVRQLADVADVLSGVTHAEPSAGPPDEASPVDVDDFSM